MPQIQGISLNVQVYSKDSVSVAVLYFLRTTVCIKQDNFVLMWKSLLWQNKYRNGSLSLLLLCFVVLLLFAIYYLKIMKIKIILKLVVKEYTLIITCL